MNMPRCIPALAIVLSLGPGCESRVGSRSPTPDQDPARYARALQDEAEAQRENRENEARFHRGPLLELAEADFAQHQSSSDDSTTDNP
ncbi:hypothetical protein AB1L88_07085 [Tautonia sp. JC769]|uniref:hypothetical protein n=1 Tax=Tautonia sp. JC769 TaxID=3232135 RepID=UPI0034589BB5